jgi:peptidoglycan/LPS O-acetylase OafA/YrhL
MATSSRLSDAAPSRSRRPYQPALDGLRAFAVAGALLFHANALKGGFLGVDLFFVLSGYLITGLLLDEGLGRGQISLSGFYTRRFRRLAPALALVLIFTLAWSYLDAPAAIAPTAATQVGWSVVYLNNWYALFGHVGYWGAQATLLPLSHLWSLAIEEQFYLVWPLLLLLMIRVGARLRHFWWLAVVLAVLSAGWQWWVADHWGVNRAYLGTDTRFTALAIGAAVWVGLAMLAERRGVARERVRPGPRHQLGQRLGWLWGVAVVASVTVLTISWFTADLTKVSLFHGWLAGCSLAAGLLIAAVATNPTAWYDRFLALPPLVWIGRRSYSIYLWHFPIWDVFNSTTLHDSGVDLWTVRLVLTAVASLASYSLVELPIRRSGFSGWKMSLGLGPVGATLLALALFVPPALPAALGSNPVVLGSGPSGGAVTTGASPSLRILVAGDSWARNMGYGLRLADPAQRDSVIDLGIPGCGLLTPNSTGCSTQDESWVHSERNDRPTAALLMEGVFDEATAVLNDGPTAACAPGFEARYTKVLDTAIATLHGSAHMPVLVTTVRDFGNSRSTTCMNRMIRAAVRREGATLFDLGRALCPHGNCVSTHDGQPVYDDTEHLAAAGQRWIGGLLLSSLRATAAATARASVTNAGPPVPGTCQTDAARVKPVGIVSYAANPTAPYLDSAAHTKLIDGIRGKATFADPAWVGFRSTSTTVVVQLDADVPVCSVASDWLQVLGGAVTLPTSVDVYVSKAPGQLGKKLGSVEAPPLGPSDQTLTLTVTGADPIPGDTVTLHINSIGDWAMTDEITAAGLAGS